MKRLLMQLVVVVMAGIPVTQAGHRGKPCDMRTGSPCAMQVCTAYGKDGKPNGSYCRKECSNSCCRCPEQCNGHNPERQPNPDEEGF